MQVYIKNPELFAQKKRAIQEAGKAACFIISDFDRTLTYGTFNGKKTPSIISLLRDGNHLSEDYAEKAHQLFDHYHAIECDSSLPLEYRKAQMQEWREKHDQLLIDSKLRLSDLKDIATNEHLQLRNGVKDCLNKLNES
jgi:hypothetical protein